MTKPFNENTRVQVPAALHLVRLGYDYISDFVCARGNPTAPFAFDPKTNILINVFRESLRRLNPGLSDTDVVREAERVVGTLVNDDLGKAFYKLLSSDSGLKLIDFENEKNVWHVTTEFTCEDEDSADSFRPDITCFVNGLPLAFIEVKKPNNREGLLVERDRIERRMNNPHFKRFFNLTQLMIFSNNQEYEIGEAEPVQGAFYSCFSRGKVFFNFFREEQSGFVADFPYREISEATEKQVLLHRNCPQIRALPEFRTNSNPCTPTNRILTSMLSRERFLFLLRYGFVYVDKIIDEKQGLRRSEKHVMRYQQFFASLEIRKNMRDGVKGGVIWHTQGSGKTALAYYNVRNLTDVFAKKNTVAKFYFIVDRIALMNQAAAEFKSRGLVVRSASSRDELMADLNSCAVVAGTTGEPEIMVVNIQRFKENREKVSLDPAFSTNIQRVFFVDEAHRGYNPAGTFLANLFEADRDAVKIALTGTPLLKSDRETWRIFGKYIHTYYYDKSVADGYTLRLMREPTETYYKERVDDVFSTFAAGINVAKKDLTPKQKEEVFECENYLSALYDYIKTDFRMFRSAHDEDDSLGAMVVCRSNSQARKFFDLWNRRIAEYQNAAHDVEKNIVAESDVEALAEYRRKAKPPLRAALILDDFPKDENERKRQIASFRESENEFDVLIVNQMLLTGFDAPRLKKLYLGRLMDGHGLLQALTRVNRPYKNFRYGFVVDFVDISENFDETNARYMRELNSVVGDSALAGTAPLPGNALFVSKEEIFQQTDALRNELFKYTTDDAEEFRREIDEIESLNDLYRLRRVLENAKSVINQARLIGDAALNEKIEKLPGHNLAALVQEVSRRIAAKRLLEDTNESATVAEVINVMLSQMEFEFRAGTKGELVIEQKNLRERLRETQDEFERNFDPADPEYVNLAEEFRKYFREHKISAETPDEFREKLRFIDDVLPRIRTINHSNDALRKRYGGDERYVRVHKRIREENTERKIRSPRRELLILSDSEAKIFDALCSLKKSIDAKVCLNSGILVPEISFGGIVLSEVSKIIPAPVADRQVREDRKFISAKIAEEYEVA